MVFPSICSLVSLTLTGDVGGYMGLLLGTSPVTVFEVLDLLLYNFILKCLENLNPERKHHSKYKTKENGTVIHKSPEPDHAHESGQAIRGDTHSETLRDKYAGFTYKTDDLSYDNWQI